MMVGDDEPDGRGVASATVAAALDALRRRVAETPRPFDHGVSIVAVTKGFGADAIAAAVAAGADAIGENYAQELRAKAPTIERLRPEVHFIGRLQSNKIRQLVGTVDVWSSVDRRSLINELGRRAPGARVRIQVDPAAERGKGGAEVHEVSGLVAAARDAGLVVDGLMTVGPTVGGPEAARPGFAIVRRLVDELGLATCSMGMSGDLVVALEEGSTELRVGTALFGPRPAR